MQMLRRLPLYATAAATSQRRAHAVAALSAPLRAPSTGSLAAAPWAATQRRGAKMLGSDVKLGNVIQRRGDKSTTLASRKRRSNNTGVFVEEKSFTFLYQEGDNITVMEPETFEQLEVSKELFGKSAAYLKDEMKVALQYFDGRPMSASVPQRVTCTVVEAQPNTKGLTAQPQYKRVLLDNGLTVLAPPFIEAGEKIVVSTADDSYMTRA